MHIETIIPFEPRQRLGFALKRAFEKVDDWALVLDHDVFLSLNPLWYEICLNAIKKLGYQAGWITCYTNNIGCPLQKNHLHGADSAESTDMKYQFYIAEDLYKKNRGQILDITNEIKKHPLSGFFMLTHRQAFDRVMEQFELKDDKFIGFDTWFSARLVELGYKIYIMQDLYVYHGYKRLWKNKEWGK